MLIIIIVIFTFFFVIIFISLFLNSEIIVLVILLFPIFRAVRKVGNLLFLLIDTNSEFQIFFLIH